MKFRGGPAAVTGDEARMSTVRSKPDGKGGLRMTREPEDERSDKGQYDGTSKPFTLTVFGLFLLVRAPSRVPGLKAAGRGVTDIPHERR